MTDILGNLSKLSCSMHLPTLPSCSLQFLLSKPVCILGQPTGRWHLPQSWNKSQLDTRSHTARHGQAALRPEKAAINTLRKLNCFSVLENIRPHKNVTILLTSVLINVGLMYRLAESDWGTQSWSISTNLLIHSSNSVWSKAWRSEATKDRGR